MDRTLNVLAGYPTRKIADAVEHYVYRNEGYDKLSCVEVVARNVKLKGKGKDSLVVADVIVRDLNDDTSSRVNKRQFLAEWCKRFIDEHLGGKE